MRQSPVPPTSNRGPMIASAITAWLAFVVISFALDTAPALNITIAATFVALVAGISTQRQLKGKTMLPTPAMVVLAVIALAVYALWFLRDTPTGIDLFFAAVVCALPIAMLVIAYRQWRRSSLSGR